MKKIIGLLLALALAVGSTLVAGGCDSAPPTDNTNVQEPPPPPPPSSPGG